MGVGSVTVLIIFFICLACYCLGYNHGKTEERLLDIESVLTGNGLDRERAEKWLQNIQGQRQVE